MDGAGRRPAPSRSPEGRQQPAIDTVVPGGLPCEHEQCGDPEEDRVSAPGAGEQVIEVHDAAEEGGDPGEHPDDQAEADADLACDDEVAEERGMRDDGVLEEPGV
jgi:hypothetical protein